MVKMENKIGYLTHIDVKCALKMKYDSSILSLNLSSQPNEEMGL